MVEIRVLDELAGGGVGDAIVGLLFAEWPAYWGGSREAVADEVESARVSEGLPYFFYIMDGGRVVGVSSLVACDNEGKAEYGPWLANVFVVEGYRGRGFGEALCRFAEGYARELGYGVLYLFTADGEAWYGRQGWALVEYFRYLGVRQSLMMKDL